MTKAMLLRAFVAAQMTLFGFGQTNSQKLPYLTWSIHSPEIVVAKRAFSTYPVGVLTPNQSIVIRRVEALSNRGPDRGFLPSGEPVACPVQYSLKLSDGTISQDIPISNAFLDPHTSQTYTDSGPLTLVFAKGNRITVSMAAPKAQFPAVSCDIQGLNVTIQYELATSAATAE